MRERPSRTDATSLSWEHFCEYSKLKDQSDREIGRKLMTIRGVLSFRNIFRASVPKRFSTSLQHRRCENLVARLQERFLYATVSHTKSHTWNIDVFSFLYKNIIQLRTYECIKPALWLNWECTIRFVSFFSLFFFSNVIARACDTRNIIYQRFPYKYAAYKFSRDVHSTRTGWISSSETSLFHRNNEHSRAIGNPSLARKAK